MSAIGEVRHRAPSGTNSLTAFVPDAADRLEFGQVLASAVSATYDWPRCVFGPHHGSSALSPKSPTRPR